jgi:hypothetical protein
MFMTEENLAPRHLAKRQSVEWHLADLRLMANLLSVMAIFAECNCYLAECNCYLALLV